MTDLLDLDPAVSPNGGGMSDAEIEAELYCEHCPADGSRCIVCAPPAPCWQALIFFGDAWVVLASGFKTRDDAEWVVARWKMQHDMRTDPFRYKLIDPEIPF